MLLPLLAGANPHEPWQTLVVLAVAGPSRRCATFALLCYEMLIMLQMCFVVTRRPCGEIILCRYGRLRAPGFCPDCRSSPCEHSMPSPSSEADGHICETCEQMLGDGLAWVEDRDGSGPNPEEFGKAPSITLEDARTWGVLGVLTREEELDREEKLRRELEELEELEELAEEEEEEEEEQVEHEEGAESSSNEGSVDSDAMSTSSS